MSSDPPPPGQPPPGSFGVSPPPLSGGAPRPGSGSGSARSGGPHSGGIRSSSAADLRANGAAEAATILRSSSQGSIRPPSSGGSAARKASREQLEPLPPGSPTVPVHTGSRDITPRSDGRSRLEPLGRPGSGSRPGSGAGRAAATTGGIPPLDLGVGGGSSSSRVPPVPPMPPGSLERDPRKARVAASDAVTQRGPVKWVPHTHANPKHAKFCFICLHGKLEGDKDGDGAEKVQQKMDEDDLPSAVDMKEMSYLLPAGSTRFARTNADFEQDNISACWLRDVSNDIYKETIRDMVAQQNADIIHGTNVGLIDDREDDADRALLAKLFTLSDEEQRGVDERLDKLGEWCKAQEARLMDVMPPPPEKVPMPEVEPPNETQKALLEYKPLLDLSKLKGETAQDVRDVIRQADAAIGDASAAEKGETFKLSDLPKPQTHPDMPDFKIVPYPLSVKDIPKYEFTNPDELVRQPVDYPADPFPRAFLHLPIFDESIMPEFDNAVSFGEPRPLPPEPIKEETWLSKTRSIFADNNEELDEGDIVFGKAPSRKRQRVLLIDEPYQPPLDIVRGASGHREIKIRGIWDPELLTPDGSMVPPIRERGRQLYQEPEFEHPDQPIWSKELAPTKPREQKVKDMIDVIPVRSFARFKPKKVGVAIPDFLWSLAREDASGQNLWTVVEQRHNIPMDIRKQEEAYAEEQRKIAQQEADAIRRTMEAEAEALRRRQEEESDDEEFDAGVGGANVTQLPSGQGTESQSPGRTQLPRASGASTAISPARPPAGASPAAAPVEQQPQRRVGEHTDGLPLVDMDAPEPPALPPLSTAEAAAERPASPAVAAASRTAPSVAGLGATTGAISTTASERMTMLRVHEDRVAGLTASPQGARSVEDLLTDERFVDTIAEKIAAKLGGPGSSAFLPGGTQTSWGGGGGVAANVGRGAHRLRPDPPSFAEPADQASRAELPRALQGGEHKKGFKMPEAQKPVTVNDVNHFTMEKMRGECYVRLLVKPEANAAKKEPIPYRGDTVPPDTTLVMGGGRPNLRMPPRPPAMNEDGDFVQDDEFAEFEKDDSIIFSFVRHNRYESIEALIQSDTSVLLAKDESGNNLLHVACQNNSRRIAKLLLRNGINVNEQNNRGNTPLHYCYHYGFMSLCEYLVHHGADDSIPNHANFLPKEGVGRDDSVGVAQQQMKATQGQGGL